MYGGSSREPPGRRSRHSRIADFQEPRGGGEQKLVIDPEMGKGQMLDGELCVIALPKRHLVVSESESAVIHTARKFFGSEMVLNLYS